MQFIGLFIGLFVVTLVVFLLSTRSSKAEKATLNRAQHISAGNGADSEDQPPLIDPARAENAKADKGLRDTSIAKHIDLLIQQGALSLSVPTVFGFCFAGAVVGFLLAWLLVPILLVEFIFFSMGALLPYLYLLLMRSRRLAAFDKALPDSMDLISRAVKAGHSVQAAFEIAGQEATQPVRSEFAVLGGQVRLGLQQNEALLQMSERIPTQDLRFMVTAVMVQRETGGNLPQVLDRTTQMIRERIRINGELRVKTTQGRISGIVLVCMPIGLALAMRILNPEWLDPLLTDPLGHYLLYYACASLLIGSALVYAITRPEA